MKLPELKTVRIAGRRIDYRDEGQGNVVFLLHGMNGQSGTWVRQFEGLSQHYRLIAWDTPGYGNSTPLDGNIAELADLASEFLKELGAGSPLVVGHSMGGVIAGRLAIDHENELAGLVLSCSHAGWGDPPGQSLRERYASRIAEKGSMQPEEYAALRAEKMSRPGTTAETLAFLGEMSHSVTIEGLKTVGRANQEANNLPGLARTALPRYILQAEEDSVIGADLTAKLVKAMPEARRILLKGVGHAPYIEDAAQYNRVIEEIAAEVFAGIGRTG